MGSGVVVDLWRDGGGKNRQEKARHALSLGRYEPGGDGGHSLAQILSRNE